MTAKVNAATRAYSTRSAPRPTPRRWATRVTSSGRSTPYTLAIRNSTNPIRLLACSRTPCRLRTKTISRVPTHSSSRIWISMSDPPVPDRDVEQDVDAVDQGLALRPGVVGGHDGHRNLDHPPVGPREQGRDLRGVRHAVHGDPQLLGHRTGEQPQPVVGVGQPQPPRGGAEQYDRAQHQPLEPRYRRRAFQEPGAQHDIVHPVLPVGVEGDQVLDTVAGQRVPQPGLQRRALAQVDRVPDQVGTGAEDAYRGVIDAAVIDAHHVGEGLLHVGDHVGDHRRLVVDRDHDPHVVVVAHPPLMTRAVPCKGCRYASSPRRTDRFRPEKGRLCAPWSPAGRVSSARTWPTDWSPTGTT